MSSRSVSSQRKNPYSAKLKRAEASPDTDLGDVTVVLVPGDRYAGLIEAIESPPADKKRAVRYLVVEGNAPAHVRSRLEKTAGENPRCKILYSFHRPTLTEAFNMAAIHIMTPYVLFLSGDMRFTAGGLEDLMDSLLAAQADLAYPSFVSDPKRFSGSIYGSACFIDPRALLLSKSAWMRLGEWEECDWRLSGVHLAYSVQALGLKTCQNPDVRVRMEAGNEPSDADKDLIQIQWNPAASRLALQRLRTIWRVGFSEHKYLEWVTNIKNYDLYSTNSVRGLTAGLIRKRGFHLNSLMGYVRILFKLFGVTLKMGSPGGR